ncbi:MAG: hypothetical protein ACI4SH_00385 [Candidatus Scatosoma sp.]
MRILTVSNRLDVLSELNGRLKKIYPEADVIGETDPLMAGKYSFNNAVDMVFTDACMKRMTGLQLIRFIRREHSGVLTYLLGTAEEIDACLTTSAFDEITGAIVYPFTEQSFKKALKAEGEG